MLRNALDLLWISFLASILIALLAMVFPALGTSGTIVPVMTGAVGAGMLHANRAGVETASGYRWKAAAVMSLVTVAVTLAIVFGMQAAGVPLLPPDITPRAHAIVWIAVTLLMILVVRLFFGMGINTMLKSKAGPTG